MANMGEEDSKAYAGCATSAAILPRIVHMVTRKAKAKAVDTRKQTPEAAPEAPISMSRARARSTTPEAVDPVKRRTMWRTAMGIMEYRRQWRRKKGSEMFNLEADHHGEWSTNWQMDIMNFEKGLPNTEVVANGKVVKERGEEVTTRPHTGRYHALMRDDDDKAIHPNVLTGQGLLEMGKINVRQWESTSTQDDEDSSQLEG